MSSAESGGALVGRDGVELISATAVGRGALLLLSGEPGIGKSRLLEEAARRARAAGLRTALGRSSEAEGAPPYRRRMAELREELADAEARADLGAASRLRAERDWIEGELADSDWLAPDRTSRARKAVYHRVQASIRRIEARLPALGRHLRNSIRTGAVCVYRPGALVAWIVVVSAAERA